MPWPGPRRRSGTCSGQARHATIAELLGASDLRIDLGVESGLAVGLYPSIVELIKTIETHLEAGYRRVKIKIQPGEDVELVRAVRQHFGDVPLMVDANGSYTVADLDVFRELDQYDLLMFEQPMAAADLDGLAALQQAVDTPVCLDETAESLERTAAAIERGAGRIVNLKIQRVGGLGPRRRSTTSATSMGSPAGSGRCPSSGSARPTASTWRPCPIASTPAISSRARDGSSTTTRPARRAGRPGDHRGPDPSRAWATTSIPSRSGAIRCASRSSRPKTTA